MLHQQKYENKTENMTQVISELLALVTWKQFTSY